MKPRTVAQRFMAVAALVFVLCAVFFSVRRPEDEESWKAQRARRILMAEGQAASHKGRYDDALAAFQKALALTDKEKDPKSWTVTASSVAEMHRYLHSWKEAEKFYTEILSLRKKHYGPAAPETSETLTNLVLLLTATQRLAEADTLLGRAVAIEKGYSGKNHANIVKMRRALAMKEVRGKDNRSLLLFLQTTHRLAEAEAAMRDDLARAESTLGKDNLNLASHIDSLAQLLKDTGRLSEAEALMRRRVRILVAFIGKSEHQSVSLWEAIRDHRIVLMEMGDTEAEAREEIGKIMEPLINKWESIMKK